MANKKPNNSRKTRSRRPATGKPTKKFVKMVNQIISKKAETKQVSYNLGITQFNSGVNSAGDVLRIVPSLSQGVSEGDRIGDTVSAQKIDIRGHFYINVVPTVANSGSSFSTAIPANARLMIRAFICSVKKYGNYDDAVTNVGGWSANFLKNGSSSQGLNGSIESMYLPVNTDVITVHKEIKKYITVPVISSAFTPVSPTTFALAASFSPTDSVKFFNHTLKCKKILKYDDTNFSSQNYAPFMVVSYAHLDGSAADVLTTVIGATYVSTLSFEDM